VLRPACWCWMSARAQLACALNVCSSTRARKRGREAAAGLPGRLASRGMPLRYGGAASPDVVWGHGRGGAALVAAPYRPRQGEEPCPQNLTAPAACLRTWPCAQSSEDHPLSGSPEPKRSCHTAARCCLGRLVLDSRRAARRACPTAAQKHASPSSIRSSDMGDRARGPAMALGARRPSDLHCMSRTPGRRFDAALADSATPSRASSSL